MANEDEPVALPDPTGPGADPRGAIGDEPVSRLADEPAAPAPGRSHGEASHSPSILPEG